MSFPLDPRSIDLILRLRDAQKSEAYLTSLLENLRKDAITPRRAGYVFVPQKGQREEYWRKEGRRKRLKPKKTSAPPKRSKAFVPNKELQSLTPVEDQNFRKGYNTSYFVKSPDGKRYVYKESGKGKADVSAGEIVCAELAQSAGVPANSVRIIPAALVSRQGSEGGTGTLHGVVPGVPFRRHQLENPDSFPDLHIQLRSQEATNNVAALIDMTSHPDLSKIGALDVFTGNCDRHRNNFLYDQETDRFHAIDMGLTFKRNLAKEMADIAEQNQQSFSLLEDERKENLGIFVKTLKQLKAKNSPESVKSRLLGYSYAAISDPKRRSEFEEYMAQGQVTQMPAYTPPPKPEANQLATKTLAATETFALSRQLEIASTSEMKPISFPTTPPNSASVELRQVASMLQYKFHNIDETPIHLDRLIATLEKFT